MVKREKSNKLFDTLTDLFRDHNSTVRDWDQKPEIIRYFWSVRRSSIEERRRHSVHNYNLP